MCVPAQCPLCNGWGWVGCGNHQTAVVRWLVAESKKICNCNAKHHIYFHRIV